MPTPTQDIEMIYKAADAVRAAYVAINRVPFSRRPALDVLLDGQVYPGDLDSLAKQLNALADEWQEEIDHAEEADDRRRDNPLEPDYRRLGQ